VAPYRQPTGAEALHAPTRQGKVRLEVAPRHVVVEIAGHDHLAVTDRFLTVTRPGRRRRRKQRSYELEGRRLVLARAVPTDDVGLWYELRDEVMQRIFGMAPPELLDRDALDAWKELDRIYRRLREALAPHLGETTTGAEYGKGADRVLVESREDRDVMYVRPLFREAQRKVMEVCGDGTVRIYGRKGAMTELECRSRFGVTVHGDRINFSGPRGDTRGHVWLPWIDEDDRAALARRLGERVHHDSESNESEYLPLLQALDRQR